MFIKDNLQIDVSSAKSNGVLFTTRHLDTLYLGFSVLNNGKPVDVSNHEIKFYVTLPDGNKFSYSKDIEISGKKFYATLPPQFTCALGKVQFEVEFTNEQGTSTSAIMNYQVTGRVKDDDCVDIISAIELRDMNVTANETLKALREIHDLINSTKDSINQTVQESQDLDKVIQDSTATALATHEGLTRKYEEVKAWAEEFDYDQSIPQIKQDIEDLKVAPTIIQTYGEIQEETEEF